MGKVLWEKTKVCRHFKQGEEGSDLLGGHL